MSGRKNSVYFTPDLYEFLKDLEKNNNREWFEKNKQRYGKVLQEPSLRFIKDLGPKLRVISRQLVADPKPFGGSLFRIYRDIRFSKDKSPYKTNLAMEFWHKKREGHSSPGLYLHIQPGENFLGAGIWHPDSSDLNRIRKAIVSSPDSWKLVFASKVSLSGDSLKRAPVGFADDHPFIRDLKRKDFISGVSFTQRQVVGPGFLEDFIEAGRRMNPLNAFLAKALGLPW